MLLVDFFDGNPWFTLRVTCPALCVICRRFLNVRCDESHVAWFTVYNLYPATIFLC